MKKLNLSPQLCGVTVVCAVLMLHTHQICWGIYPHKRYIIMLKKMFAQNTENQVNPEPKAIQFRT